MAQWLKDETVRQAVLLHSGPNSSCGLPTVSFHGSPTCHPRTTWTCRDGNLLQCSGCFRVLHIVVLLGAFGHRIASPSFRSVSCCAGPEFPRTHRALHTRQHASLFFGALLFWIEPTHAIHEVVHAELCEDLRFDHVLPVCDWSHGPFHTFTFPRQGAGWTPSNSSGIVCGRPQFGGSLLPQFAHCVWVSLLGKLNHGMLAALPVLCDFPQDGQIRQHSWHDGTLGVRGSKGLSTRFATRTREGSAIFFF